MFVSGYLKKLGNTLFHRILDVIVALNPVKVHRLFTSVWSLNGSVENKFPGSFYL